MPAPSVPLLPAPLSEVSPPLPPGYQLCDNSVGVLFNDSTRLILYNDGDSLQYIERDGTESYLTVNSHPNSLLKKASAGWPVWPGAAGSGWCARGWALTLDSLPDSPTRSPSLSISETTWANTCWRRGPISHHGRVMSWPGCPTCVPGFVPAVPSSCTLVMALCRSTSSRWAKAGRVGDLHLSSRSQELDREWEVWDLFLVAGREWSETPQPAGLSSLYFLTLAPTSLIHQSSSVCPSPSFPHRTTPNSSCAHWWLPWLTLMRSGTFAHTAWASWRNTAAPRSWPAGSDMPEPWWTSCWAHARPPIASRLPRRPVPSGLVPLSPPPAPWPVVVSTHSAGFYMCPQPWWLWREPWQVGAAV